MYVDGVVSSSSPRTSLSMRLQIASHERCRQDMQGWWILAKLNMNKRFRCPVRRLVLGPMRCCRQTTFDRFVQLSVMRFGLYSIPLKLQIICDKALLPFVAVPLPRCQAHLRKARRWLCLVRWQFRILTEYGLHWQSRTISGAKMMLGSTHCSSVCRTPKSPAMNSKPFTTV